MIFKLAWRNIWRNKRRTYITAASILFAVLLASFMESLQKGAWNNMIGNVVNFYVGYAQVHQQGYWDDQSLDKAIPFTKDLQNIPNDVPEVKNVLPRIESFALASTGNTTTGVLVIGIEPEVENRMTQLQTRIVEGNYLNINDQAALVAEGVAENLNLELGDTIVLVSQGYHGVNAAGKYYVKGILHFGSPELNKQMVYLPLKEAQWFFGAEGLITSLALHIEQPGDVIKAVKGVKAKLNTDEYEVMDWEELLPDLVKAKALDSAGNYIVYFILYLIIAFGIFGTILMMTKERSYEFGVLVSIGMRRLRLSTTVWLEVIMLGLLGAVAGILCSIPIVLYFRDNPIQFSGSYAAAMERYGFEPIFPATFNPNIFITQAIIVLILTALLALYPLFKIGKLKPVEAMRD
ncbi:MAG: ABC transporter permease [Saprospiraceae bacterium]|nr:ABC transporter permease [Saprospiraceae bacterium]